MSESIIVQKEPLAEALALVARVVEKRASTIPIISHVLIEPAPDGRLRIGGTDLDMACVVDIAMDRPAAFAPFAAPAQILHDIVRKIPARTSISITPGNDGRCAIKAGRLRLDVATLPEQDWPRMPGPREPVTFTLPAPTLARMLERVQFAISNEETRYYLNGVFLRVAGGRIVAVATDGHKLAKIETEAPEQVAALDMPGVIVPRKAVAETLRLIEKIDGDVEISIETNRIGFAARGATLTTKLIDGTYPDYSRVIPTQWTRRAMIDRAGLAQAADRVATIGGERGRAVKFTFDADTLRLDVVNPDMGAASEEVECQWRTEDDTSAAPLEIGFNSAYVAAILQTSAAATARLRFIDAAWPAEITFPGEGDFLAIIMPKRV